MNTPQDGGPAFPVQDEIYGSGERQYGSNGMTLRDYFANTAMQSLASIPQTMTAIDKGAITIPELCGAAYEWADAMLAARSQTQTLSSQED